MVPPPLGVGEQVGAIGNIIKITSMIIIVILTITIINIIVTNI